MAAAKTPTKRPLKSERTMSEAAQKYLHQIYFRLADRAPKTRETFLEFCWKYLAGHKGMEQFELGLRDIEMQRPVSDQAFDVSVTMIFKNRIAYDVYRQDPRHNEWITLAGSMSVSRRVFDSYLIQPLPGRKKRRGDVR